MDAKEDKSRSPVVTSVPVCSVSSFAAVSHFPALRHAMTTFAFFAAR